MRTVLNPYSGSLQLVPAPEPPPAAPGPLEFVQASPSAAWLIPHGLGRYPLGLQAFDADGHQRSPDVFQQEPGVSTLLTFSTPVAGKATYE